MQLCLTCAVASYDSALSDGDLFLLPLDPVVEDGQFLTLNCTIQPRYTGNYTNRDLYFRHGSTNFRNVTLVGSKTALLKMRWNLTGNVTGGGHVWCALPDRLFDLKAAQHVTVVRRPLQPNVTSCLVLNWKLVNCTWQPNSSQQQQHMHTSRPLIKSLQWKLSNEVNDPWQDAACDGDVTDSCAWDISDVVGRFIKSESCCVQVFARTNFTYPYLHFEVQSEQFCFVPAHNVVLDRPRNVTAVDAGSREMFVRWQATLLDLDHVGSAEVVYSVLVMSQWSDIPVVNQSVVSQSLLFTSVPHTHYAISVHVKTVESQIWSKPTFHDITTASAVPKMSPPSSANAFTVTHVERDVRTVIVYWKRLPVQDHYGPWLSYVVLVRKPPESHWTELSIVKSADKSCAEVYVSTDADVELTVIARNEVGDTLLDVVMQLPAFGSSRMTTSVFVELAVELTNDSSVVWSWQLESSEYTGSLTLIWCRSHLRVGLCVGDIHWLDVTASHTEYKLSIDAHDTSHYHYGAALKADSTHHEISGIEWVTCLYNVTGLAAPVQDVQAVVPSFGHPGQLLVTWVHPACDSGYRRGYIKSLMLYYCRSTGTECVDEPSHVSVPGYLSAYSLTGLDPDVEYSIWMYSWSRGGQSLNRSDIVTAMTSASVMTPGLIAGVAVASVIVFILAVAVVWMLFKYCRRCLTKLWSPMTITVPTPNIQANAGTVSSPIVDYSRISYARQGSRLSSSSRDSGQFGVASGSPLMSPKSLSESAIVPLMAADNHTRQQQPHVDSVRPATMTYVNDRVVALLHPTENARHRPTSSGHTECFPLQPMKSHQPHEATVTAAVSDEDDDRHVTDSLVNSQLNGGCDTRVLRPHSDYIPHEWLKM